MIPSCLRDCEKLLELTVILIGIFSTSSLKQCGPETTLIFRNVGIKLCQLKCTENGQCLSFEYDIETLTCRLLRDVSQKIEKEGHVSLLRNYSDVPNGSCASKICSLGERCLKTRSGKAVCVQGGKQNPTKPPQHEADKQESSVENLLHDACKHGDLGKVRCILFRAVVDVDCRDERGTTPLMLAARMGHRRIFSFLIRKGANVSHVDELGRNVLHLASRGHVAMVKEVYVVTRYCVDVNSRTLAGETALMIAVYYGNRDVAEFLVSKGGNVSLVDKLDKTILHWACKGRHVEMVKYVISNYSIDVNSCGSRGKASPLKEVALKGHKDVFDVLVSMGANVSQVDEDGDNILHAACRGGHVGMVEYLVSKCSIDINSRGQYGASPLMKAGYAGHKNIFDVLICMGADVAQVDDSGDNIVHWVCRRRHGSMVNYLFSNYSFDINSRGSTGKTPLMYASLLGNRDVFDVVVSLGANVSQVDDHGENILHHASHRGQTKMVQHIISQDFVNINCRGKYGRTPLMWAAWCGHRKVFGLLVSEGGLTEMVDAEGHTILHLASLGGRVDMVKYILSQNLADINAIDKNGKTAAMIAKRKAHFEVYNLLVSRSRPPI